MGVGISVSLYPESEVPPVTDRDMRDARVILIGGTSHVGKSTLARAIASKLDWGLTSTDSLARHPGRPWKTEIRSVPQPVADHYLSLSVDELIADVLSHYRGMWAGIGELVRTHATDPAAGRMIFEGSALWPESVPALSDLTNVATFWLTADSELLESRIIAESRYDEGTATEKALIEKFIERSVRYDDLMMDAVNRLGLVSIDVGMSSSVDELMEQCLHMISS